MSIPHLEQLLSESIETARRREREAFDLLAGHAESKLVLFGAGVLGRKVLASLRRRSLEPVAFTDSQTLLHGTRVEGLDVLPPAEAAAKFGTAGIFLVTIFRGMGDGGMRSREAFLRELGCRRVTSFLPLAWKHASDLLPHYGAERPSVLLEAAPELRKLDAAWGDGASREVYRGQLLWRLRGDFSGLGAPSPDQYFPRDLVRLRADEALVDAGAYDGDTLRAPGVRFAQAWAIEPNPSSAARLREWRDPRITVIQCALGETSGEARFSSGLGVASALSAGGETTVRVETLDRLLADESPTFLKLDVEGAEQAALEGARELLRRRRPLAAVCLYHRPDDLWRIPIFLRQALPDHRLFLRAHQNDGFELVVYAIPPDRLR